MGRKNVIAKGRHRRRKERREHGPVRDDKYWACGRKILYATKEEADRVAAAMGHVTYPCSYGDHFHTAHLPGSKRFIRGVAVA